MTDFFWKVEETVGDNRHYIIHPATYRLRAAAEAEAAKYPRARAVLYQTGKGNGPIRVGEP